MKLPVMLAHLVPPSASGRVATQLHAPPVGRIRRDAGPRQYAGPPEPLAWLFGIVPWPLHIEFPQRYADYSDTLSTTVLPSTPAASRVRRRRLAMASFWMRIRSSVSRSPVILTWRGAQSRSGSDPTGMATPVAFIRCCNSSTRTSPGSSSTKPLGAPPTMCGSIVIAI